MANVTIYTIPVGSQFTSTIGTDDSDDKNDFSVLLVWDENVDGLTLSDCSIDNMATLESIEGENSVYEVVVRPTAGNAVPLNTDTTIELTFTVAADAVSQGNSETSKTIRLSREFPDTDGVTPSELFPVSISQTMRSIAVSPTRIIIGQTTSSTNGINFFTHSGTARTSENLDILAGQINYFNNTLLIGRSNPNARYALDGTLLESYTPTYTGNGMTQTRLGILRTPEIPNLIPYGETTGNDIETRLPHSFESCASQGDLIYMLHDLHQFGYAKINEEDEVEFVKYLNIKQIDANGNSVRDIAIYKDLLYTAQDDATTIKSVYTLDIKPYRPMTLNTKSLIHPVIITGDATIDLTQYAPDAETITFDVGFDKPSWMSISSNTLSATGTTTIRTCFVSLRGFNRIDGTEKGMFGLYLILMPAAAPVWNSVSDLAMRANTAYNLRQLVDADTIVFRAGITQPTGSSLSDGVFTIGATSGEAQFTATKNSLDSHKTLQIDVIQTPDNIRGTRTRYKVEIEGIDISVDLLNVPTVSENLDPIAINETRINEATIRLKNHNKYDINKSGNFWDANSLNSGGFQNSIKLYTEHLVSGTWTESLLFSGVISESFIQQDQQNVFFQMNCVDASRLLQNIVPQSFGRLEKWSETRQTTDEETYQGVYAPEMSVLPIQPQLGKAWSNKTALTLSMLQNQSEGVIPSNTGYLTDSEFRTAGGDVDTNPLLNYNTVPRGIDVESVLRLLSADEMRAYNIEIDLAEKTLNSDYSLNRGNVARNVQQTRNTLLITDWVFDTTANRVLMLLSNPEAHLQDLILQYSLDDYTYRTLYTFAKNIKAHRMTRRNTSNYYILTSDNITQDRSRSELLRQSDKTGYNYDSISAGSNIRIHHFDASTNTLTEHVPEDDDRPPQMGIHYHIGFENIVYVDEFEGIRPENRGAFKTVGTTLYYRYVTDGEFGVASVDTSGTTSDVIAQTTLNYHNHLNFAFDVLSNDTVYFVYAVGDDTESSLVIKRDVSGTETTILTDTQDFEDLTHLDENGGAYLGCYEALFHNNNLYMLCPIQRVDEDSGTYTRSQMKAAGMVLFSCDVTVSSPALTKITQWDFVTHSGCNLTIHNGNVHYLERSIASEVYKPINSEL